MMTKLAVTGVAVALALSAQWGRSTQSMRADIRGGGGDRGKCTIEVEVDHVADVEIRGDSGVIRTLEGQPSSWRRFVCTSPMPRNPAEFRFRGIDGRGNVNLVRSPERGGVAVVRIEDSKGGREGYTFDLEWRGGYDPDYRENTRNQPLYDRGRSTVSACEDAVRVKARRDYDVRNPRFSATGVEDMRGNRDRVVGSFEGNRGDYYEYSCRVQENNGRIRSVEIRRR